jgi:tyrosyl-tRNA synthetase
VLVHGEGEAAKAVRASAVLYGEDIDTLPVEDVLSVFEDVPSTELRREEFAGEGVGLVDLVARSKLASSRSEARRLVQAGGVYVNNRRETDPQSRLLASAAIGGVLFVLRKGSKQMHLLRLT